MDDIESQKTDLDKRTEQFLQLRDKIKAIKEKHAAELKPYNEAVQKFEAFFLNTLEDLGVSSVKGPHGTVYKRAENSATVADAAAFKDYILERDAFELADIRANKVAVREFVEAHGTTPPGVNFTTHMAVGCRRGSGE